MVASRAMRVADFEYSLPAELIAQQPLPERSAARLLALEGPRPEDSRVRVMGRLLRPGDLLVINDTRVIPARLRGRKATGGQVEILIERIESSDTALAMVRASKSPPIGSRMTLEEAVEVEVLGREGMFFRLRLLNQPDFLAALKAHGHVPLPPYIERPDRAEDQERYQTIYAAREGAVAAPTAGLHFDRVLLDAFGEQGVDITTVTLHVGAGTFQPVKVDDTSEHEMHSEYAEIGPDACAAVDACRERGGRVVAVGTTAVRTLESAAAGGTLVPFAAETRLFITPGYRFQVVDRMFTNFHLPQSTLLMLVTAFGGYRRVLEAYRHAVRERYRFFSYGDAMWIAPGDPDDLPPSLQEGNRGI